MRLSDHVMTVLTALWPRPWASAGDLALATGLKAPHVHACLRRAEQQALVFSVELGRVRQKQARFAFHQHGVRQMELMVPGMRRAWWHSEVGLRILADRLQMPEVLYPMSHRLWQSNALQTQVWMPVLASHEVKPVDWRDAQLLNFRWIHGSQSAAIQAVAEYKHESLDQAVLIPFAWFGSYHRPNEVKSWRGEMEKLAYVSPNWGGDGDRWHFPGEGTQHYRGQMQLPGVMIIVPHELAGLRVLREVAPREPGVKLGIVDVAGTLISGMEHTTAVWGGMKPAVPDAPLRLGCPEDLAKKLLTDRKYSALNGVREWNSMDWLRGYPGSHIGQVTAGAGLSRGAARSIVERMKDAGVAQKFETDLYLGNRGINAVAQAEAVHVNRVGRRLKVYLKKRANPEVEPPAGGPKKQRPRTYREKQLIHGQGVADLTIALQREGFYVVSGPDMTVNFRQLGVQIKPDLYVKLPPLGDGDATWAALEYERSAVTVKAIVDKLGPYQTLLEAGLHPPLLVVTETEAAAAMFAELGGAYPLMVTTADRALKGPHMTEEGDNLRLGIWGFEASFDQEDPFEYSIEMWKRQLERQLDRLPFAPWTAPWKNPIQYR